MRVRRHKDGSVGQVVSRCVIAVDAFSPVGYDHLRLKFSEQPCEFTGDFVGNSQLAISVREEMWRRLQNFRCLFCFPSLLSAILLWRKLRVAFLAQSQMDDVNFPAAAGVFEQCRPSSELHVRCMSTNSDDAQSLAQ